MELIKEGNNLILENGPEIIYLEAIVDNLQDEKDINKIIKASSKMLRTLDGLIPNLESASANLCISTSEDSVKAFKDLANILEEISNNGNFHLPSNSKQLLLFSSKFMDQTAEFLESLERSLEQFKRLCNSDMEDGSVVYTSIIEILESLAGLFEVIGFEEKSAGILKQGMFIKEFVDEFKKLEDLIPLSNVHLVAHTVVWHWFWMILVISLKVWALINFPRSWELT